MISLCGCSLTQWQSHLWLQKLPIPALGRRVMPLDCAEPHNLLLVAAADAAPEERLLTHIALNLELPPPERTDHWLSHLRIQQGIWDPDPDRVRLLQDLGLPAHWLDPAAPANGWLQQPAAADPGVWGAQLGLAPPVAGEVVVLGPAGSDWDRALAQEALQVGPAPTPAIAYLPGWPELISASPAAALAQAGWLAAAADRAAQLVWIQNPAARDPVLAALGPLASPPLALQAPLTPEELRSEVAGGPLALAEDRPTPALEELYSWQGQPAPKAAVVVSLYNYAHRIEAALDSVASQTQPQLELIVVDDASSDASATVVQAWMQARRASGQHPFVRLQLLRHGRNGGLATARNTALAAAQSPWCFVLDADNALYPDAVRACLAVAQTGPEALAVVHPLVAVEAEPGRPDERRSLVSTAPWQRDRLRTENVVDAMALVRRSAWQSVGGYTHIDGGWEDYDFWCKLVAAGFHGIQCPRVLAVYRSHVTSMSHTATNRRWRALSRTLQRRHPWLQLPLAR